MPQASKQKGWYFNASEKGGTATIVIEGTVGGYDWDADTWEEFIRNRKKAFRKKLQKLANNGVKKLDVQIDSLGGLLNHGLSIHDLLKGFDGEVTTTTMGFTASAATIIAQAASKGKRRISANSLYLIHKSMIPAFYANRNDLEVMIEDAKKMDDTIKGIYKRNTAKKNHAGIDRLMEANGGHGVWITAEDAVAHGLADEVVETGASSSVNFVNVARGMNLPEIPKELLEKIGDNSASANTDALTKEFFNMSFIEDLVNRVVEKIKGKGVEVDESTAADIAKSFTEEELQNITAGVVSDSLKPLDEKIAALEEKLAANAGEPKVEEAEETDIAKAIADAIAKELAPLNAKIEGIEKSQEEKVEAARLAAAAAKKKQEPANTDPPGIERRNEGGTEVVTFTKV